MTDAAPAKVLDRFLCRLASEVKHQVLVQQPWIWQLMRWLLSALLVQWAKLHIGLLRGTRALPRWSWDRPRDGAMQLTLLAEVLQVGIADLVVLVVALYHYHHQPGHFMRSCPKLKRDMAMRLGMAGCCLGQLQDWYRQ